MAALASLALLAVFLRGYHLGWPPLWVDEAESSINALTIVADGVPRDHFLGQPLYENTLVRPWPENDEYEFKDISYSDKGLAVYHGWLPLYAMAGAFRLAGVTPQDARQGTPPRDATAGEIYRWTVVPRLPSLAFSAVFVVAAYGLGRALRDAPVGWGLAFAAATANIFVWFGRQARYYSATLAGSAVCGLAIWNALRRGRLSDHALAGLALGALFHIHALSAVALAGVYVVSLPLARGQSGLWRGVLMAGAVAGVLILPWVAWSGFLDQTGHIPPARHYLDVPLLLGSVSSMNPVLLGVASLGLLWLAVARVAGGRFRERWYRPILDQRAPLWFAATWLTLSYLSFTALMPVASYFIERLKLMLAVPGLLLSALTVAALARVWRPSWRALPGLGLALLLVLAGQLPPHLALEDTDHGFREMVGNVRAWSLGPGGRILASPNDHLVLTYYSGRPVQSIAPVRREWLDHATGDVVILEGPWFLPPTTKEVQAVARRLRWPITPAEAKVRADVAPGVAAALDLVASGRAVVSPPSPDPLDQALVRDLRDTMRQTLRHLLETTPIGRAAAPSNAPEWRHAFFYWFSDPDRRSGTMLNYAACRDSALVHVHRSGFVVYDCRRTRETPLMAAATTSGGSP